jgi:hypothetical protein
MDPVGARAIVNTSALPRSLQPAPSPIAGIVATAKPSVGGVTNVANTQGLTDPLNVLDRKLNSQLGPPGGGFSLDSIPHAEVVYLDFTGSRSQVENWAQALRSSDLFASVTINWADTPTPTPGI